MYTSQRASRIAIATLLSLGLLLFVAIGTASAHAAVISATPGIGSTITQAPTTVSVKTAENMKPGAQFSNLFVYGPSGALVSQGDAKSPLNDPTTMSITITPEKNPGVYIVRWITVSLDDNDPDQGAFIFTVNPAGAAATTPAPTRTTQQTVAPTQTPAVTSGTPTWVPILVGALGLLVGLGGGVAIGRRRPTPAMATTGAEQEEMETSKHS